MQVIDLIKTHSQNKDPSKLSIKKTSKENTGKRSEQNIHQRQRRQVSTGAMVKVLAKDTGLKVQ